jgi:hypothetical protein
VHVHGVPPDLDLSPFIGATLERIDLGKWILHFRFAMQPAGSIAVEGEWELLDHDGEVIDRQQEPSERAAYHLHHLLLQDVTAFEVHAPQWFSLTFNNGMILKVYDDSKQYESFAIQPGNIYI